MHMGGSPMSLSDMDTPSPRKIKKLMISGLRNPFSDDNFASLDMAKERV